MLNMNGTAAAPPTRYAERLEAFRKSDSERDALVAEVINELEELIIKNSELLDDYNNEIASRRMWQAKASQFEQQLAQTKQASGSSNFAVALIDGDGAIFQDSLYAMGKDGGAEAATLIHAEFRRHLQDLYPDANVKDWNIVVQVILNLQGLASKLLACGIIQNQNELMAFGRAFGLAQPLFSFVDVGSGKERADHKIRETLRMYLPIAQCKHVFFAPCNDNGYLPVLESYRRDTTSASRITLVETRPAEPGFDELGLKMIQLRRVFRSDNLPTFRNVPTMAQAPATTTKIPLGAMHGNSVPNLPNIPKATSPAPPTDSTSSVANANCWATVGKSGASSKNISIAPKKAAPARRHILLNKYDDRLDPDLPKTDQAAEARFADRVKAHGKYCNNYYLTGRCEKGKYCDYHHGEKLTPGELLVLTHKARSLRCPGKNTCRNFECTAGHHCKYGAACYMELCYFLDTHNMDMEPAKAVYQDGTEEWISGHSRKI